jgi:hypothetical protein
MKNRTSNVIPFDKGEPHKAFTNLLDSLAAGGEELPFELPRKGKALVPGCGRVSLVTHLSVSSGLAFYLET